MRIRQQFLTSYLAISLMSIGISFGVVLSINEGVESTFRNVAGTVLPGSIALSQATSEFYKIEVLVNKFESTRTLEAQHEIERSLAKLAAYQTTHRLFHQTHPHYANTDHASEQTGGLGFRIDQLTADFSQAVAQYLLLAQRDADAETLKKMHQRVDAILREFTASVGPQIDEDLAVSMREIKGVESSISSAHHVFAAVGLLIILLAILASIQISNRIARPLRKLSDAAKAIGEGDFKGSVDIVGRNEIGDLARAFVDMRDQLSVTRKDLLESNALLMLDIDIRKRAELEMHRAMETAEAANRAKSEFLTVMSHELRTPMNAILGITELLTDAELDEESQGYLEVQKRAGNALLEMINDILDLSRMEAGQVEVYEVPFDLRETLDSVIAFLRAVADSKELTLNLRIPEELEDLWVGDPARIRQILVNLVGNAIKFTDKGEVTLEVVRADGGKGLRFVITDTGIGIGEEDRKRIFHAFTQVDSSNTRQYGGTGLGLSIVQRLVAVLGGRVWVRSEPGQGSRFYVELPLTPDGVPRDTNPDAPPKAVGGGEAKGLHILLAEDSPDNAMLIRSYLKETDYTLTVVENGEQALEAVTSAPYDLVLMDMQMPTMDGYEATRRIRGADIRVDGDPISILALTAHALEGDREKCLATGCNDYLSKPIKKKMLLDAIAQHSTGK